MRVCFPRGSVVSSHLRIHLEQQRNIIRMRLPSLQCFYFKKLNSRACLHLVSVSCFVNRGD